ncbi:MAG: ribosome small subunit-dependent GTPase A [Acidimicrobiales bacterium]
MASSATVRATLDREPSTGDFVTIVDDPDDGPLLDRVAERRTLLTRRAPGRIPLPQILAANADEVLVIHGLDREFNARRIERQLVLAFESGAVPVIVLTKADLCDDPEEQAVWFRELAPSVDVITTSARTANGLDQLRNRLSGTRTLALLGLSGIGKSSIVNALCGDNVQRVNEVREKDSRGRHTTVTRDLIVLADGGILIDTPGVREFGLWQSYDGLAAVFPQLSQAECRFADCDHGDEPGCGVQALLAEGLVARERFDHWMDLRAELAQQELDIEVRDKKAATRERQSAKSPKRRRKF